MLHHELSVILVVVAIDYRVEVRREENQFIAHALPINVASPGDSPENARKALDEAVRVFIASAKAHGTLKEVLEGAGYESVTP